MFQLILGEEDLKVACQIVKYDAQGSYGVYQKSKQGRGNILQCAEVLYSLYLSAEIWCIRDLRLVYEL